MTRRAHKPSKGIRVVVVAVVSSVSGAPGVIAGAMGLTSVGCQGAGPTNTSTSSGVCDLVTMGPLIYHSPAAGPRGVPMGGGPIADGIYDLVQIVGGAQESTGLRIALRFLTDERAADHTSGRLMVTWGAEPSSQCYPGRFAIVGTRIRTVGTPFSGDKVSNDDYAATPDGRLLWGPLVFHRR